MTWTGAPSTSAEHRAIARVMLLSLVLHLAAAHFTLGYAHPDEHFQVLEFGAAKLGIAPTDTLPWEFSHRLRPFFLPAVFAAIAGGLRKLGVSSPFAWSEAMRAVAAFLGWVSHVAIVRSSRVWLPSTRARVQLAACFAFAFYLPYLDARTSSESFAASFFLLGVAAAIGGELTALGALGVGIAFGLSFEARFQAAMLIGGMGLWLLVVRRWPWSRLFPLVAGFLLVFAAGRAIDAWGYGVWTLSPWNYFRENLLLHKAAAWGVSPPWGFIPLIVDIVPPFGALALVLVPLAWVRAPRHPLTWSSVPFVLVHCAIGHKEARFLAPIAAMMPVLLVLALPRLFEERRLRWLVGTLAIENAIALVLYTFVPAFPTFEAYRALYRRSNGQNVEIVALASDDPYRQAELPVWLVRAPNASVRRFADEPALRAYVALRRSETVLRWQSELSESPTPGCVIEWSRVSPRWKASLPALLRPAVPNPGFEACR